MKNLTCDVCGTNQMVATYILAKDVLNTDQLPFNVYTASHIYTIPKEVEVCQLCFQQVGERYKKFLMENNLTY